MSWGLRELTRNMAFAASSGCALGFFAIVVSFPSWFDLRGRGLVNLGEIKSRSAWRASGARIERRNHARRRARVARLVVAYGVRTERVVGCPERLDDIHDSQGVLYGCHEEFRIGGATKTDRGALF